MHREAIAALSDGGPIPDLSDSDDQADRLYAITDRSFSRALSRLREVDRLSCTRSELFELWSTARDLERIADHAERIGTIASELDGSVHEEYVTHLQDLAERAQAVVEHAVSCVVNEEKIDEAYEALTLRTEIRERTNTLDQRLFVDSTADYRLARILDGVRRSAEHGGNIAERGLHGAIRCRTTTDSNANAHGNQERNGDVVNATESGR
jgi:Na+/phosphate symporter